MSRFVLALAVALLAAAAGCAGNQKDPEELPAKLVPTDDTVRVNRLWRVRVGDGGEKLRLGLQAASDGAYVFAAGHGGRIGAYDVASGRRVWQLRTELALSAGPGVGEGIVVAASSQGEVIAVGADDGLQLWTGSVGGEVLASPQISAGAVILRTTDGRLIALSADDGSERWLVQQSSPRLSLRGQSAAAITGGLVISGFDNGRVLAVDIGSGTPLWEQSLGIPGGRTELDRLADVDSDVAVVGDDVYVVGYQSRAALLTLEEGRQVWDQELSSVGPLGVDWSKLYITTPGGEVVALDRSSGAPEWRQSAMVRRGLTGPENFGDWVVVGDFEGYLHFLSAEDGSLVARTRTGKDAIIATPLAVGERLYVYTEGGELQAFSAEAR